MANETYKQLGKTATKIDEILEAGENMLVELPSNHLVIGGDAGPETIHRSQLAKNTFKGVLDSLTYDPVSPVVGDIYRCGIAGTFTHYLDAADTAIAAAVGDELICSVGGTSDVWEKAPGAIMEGNLNGDLNAQDYKILNLANATDDTDALSLGSAKDHLFKAGLNLFDKTKATLNYYIAQDGSLHTSSTYFHSGFIPVTVGETYKCNNNMRFTCYYDSNKVVFAGGSSSTITSFTVPVGVAFVIFSGYMTDGVDVYQLEKGSSVSPYEPYVDIVTKDGADAHIKKTYDAVVVKQSNNMEAVVPKSYVDAQDLDVINSIDEVMISPILKSIIDNTDGYILIHGKNLYDKSGNLTGYWNWNAGSEGDFVVNANWFCSNYIPCNADIGYVRNVKFSGGLAVQRDIFFYDADKNYIGQLPDPDDLIFTTPTNCAYMTTNIGSIPNSWDLSDTLQIEEGSVSTVYEAYKKIIALRDKQVTADKLANSLLSNLDSVTIPDTVYAVVGELLQVFWKSLIEGADFARYGIQLVSDLTTCVQYQRYFEVTPDTAGTFASSINVINELGVIIASKSFNIEVSAAGSLPASIQCIGTIGDSLSNVGEWQKPLRDKIVSNYGSATNLEWIGHKTHSTDSNVKFSANAGWSWIDYGIDMCYEYPTGTWVYNPFFAHKLTISAGTAQVGDIYAISTNNWLKVERLNGSVAYCSWNKVSAGGEQPAMASSGTLTKISGSGNATAWNAYSGGLSFTDYMYAYYADNVTENGDNLLIYILLGWNDLESGKNADDHTATINYAKVLIDFLHTEYPNAQVALMSPNIGQQNVQAYYTTRTNAYKSRFETNLAIWGLCKAYENWANDAAYSAFVDYIGNHHLFDSDYGCLTGGAMTDKQVNKWSSITEKVPDIADWIHPTEQRFMMDTAFNYIVSKLFQ